MTRSIFLRLALAIGVLLSMVGAGCSDRPASSSNDGSTASRVIQSKELHIGYLAFDPCVVKDVNTGQLSGTYVDAIEVIAKQLGVKPAYHETTVSTFAAGLEARQFDLSIGPTYATIPRASTVVFCRTLNYLGNSGVVRTADATKYNTLEAIAASQPRIAVQQGQAMDEFFTRRFSTLSLLRFSGPGLSAQLDAVAAGQADVGFMNALTVRRYLTEHKDLTGVFLDEDELEVLPLAWAVRSDDFHWYALMNTSIDYLTSTGRWDEIQAEYGIRLR